MARVPVEYNARPEAYQTTARPYAVDVGAPSAPRGGLLDSLAASLSAVTPGITEVVARDNDRFRERETNNATDAFSAMTFDQAQELVSSGRMKKENSPYFQAAFSKQFGLAYAARRQREISDAYANSFDKSEGDIDTFLADFARSDVEAYGDNKFILAGIREGMQGYFEKVRDTQSEVKSAEVHSQTVDQFFQIARAEADKALAAGKDPSAAVRALYGPHRSTLGLSYGEMDQSVLALAEQYAAEGNTAAVNSLLTTDITGEDGQKVGSFVGRPGTAQQSKTLIERAKAKQAEDLRSANTTRMVDIKTRAEEGALTPEDKTQLDAFKTSEQVSQPEHESILKTNADALVLRTAKATEAAKQQEYLNGVSKAVLEGRAFTVPSYTSTDAAGRTNTISSQDAVEMTVRGVADAMAAKGASPTVIGAQLSKLGTNTTIPAWEKALTDGVVSINAAFATTDKTGAVVLPPSAMAGYELWKSLADTPQVRNLHTDDKGRVIWEDAELLESLGQPADQALAASARVNSGGIRNAGLSLSIEPRAFEQATNSLTKDGTNGAFAQAQVERMTRLIMAGFGVPQKKATEQAVARFKRSYTQINDVWVNTRNTNIPATFPDAARFAIEAYAKQTGGDAGDYTLVPTSTSGNQWIIADATTLMPVVDGPAEGGLLTTNQITANWHAESLRKVEEGRAKAATEQQSRDASKASVRGAYDRLNGTSR